MTKLRPLKWCELLNITIMDSDGWDRRAANFEKDWNRFISFHDFVQKASISTTQHRDGFTYKLMYDSMISCHIFYFGKNLKRKKNIISGLLRNHENFTFNIETNEINIECSDFSFSTNKDNVLIIWYRPQNR